MPAANSSPMIRHRIAGISVADLVRQFGTPCYVYDAARIDKRIEELRSFDVIRYAQKANSNLAVLDHVRRRGCLVDTVSAGEIHRALAAGYVAGGEPPNIVYTADIFDRDSLELVIEHGIHVNCGSPEMIDQLSDIAPGRSVTLRVNPGFGHGHSRKTDTGGATSKHGIWFEQVPECLIRADHGGLSVSGLHMHIGSGSDSEHLGKVCQAMVRTAQEVGRSLTSISAGGGLPIPYRENDASIDVGQYYQRWNTVRRELEGPFGHAISLEIEPGRFIAAESGFLLAEVRAVKIMGGNLFYLVDAGFNNLARPILYGAYHPISLAPASGRDDLPMHEVVVGGPLCESGDIFTQEAGGFVGRRRLPAAQVGDILIIECTGAYGFTMASNYNSKPLAPEVLIRNGQPHLVRERQSPADMLRNERIPKCDE